jgi:hypothetical protein
MTIIKVIVASWSTAERLFLFHIMNTQHGRTQIIGKTAKASHTGNRVVESQRK